MTTSTLDGLAVREIRPLEDSRWNELVQRHPRSSVFHTPAWLEALRRTYNYDPVVMTTSGTGTSFDTGLVFCHVRSRLTGSRLVSLPFSDHCDFLTDDDTQSQELLKACKSLLDRDALRYLELRLIHPCDVGNELFRQTYTYCFHVLDLSPDVDTLFHNLHKDSTQRKIRRAERENLVYKEGRSEAFIDEFYRLTLLTRRRQGLPPQPRIWFRNLADCFGDGLKIRLALKDDYAVAAILTLRHKEAMVYKYGCSDPAFNNLGGTHLLFWKTIEEAKQNGLKSLDLGRSDSINTGLITFKDRWGSARSNLFYSRLSLKPARSAAFTPAGGDWKEQIARRVVSELPDRALTLIGELFYRHIG